jgi:hypothetical protein
MTQESTGWPALSAELALWAAAGRKAAIWWRDDDATTITPALERALQLSRQYRVPLALAVIPRRVRAELSAALNSSGTIAVLQHGFDHTNHAPAGERAAEFGTGRTLAAMRCELADGWKRLAGLPREPVFVPPWNRYNFRALALFGAVGLVGISAFGNRQRREPYPGVVQINCHCDIISWRATRAFVGEAKAIAVLVGQLAARRKGDADANEPTGLLSHHLAHDEACWQFLEELFQRTVGRDGIEWISAATALARSRAKNGCEG